MKIKAFCFRLCLSVFALALVAAQVQADVIVNDNFSDNDRAKTSSGLGGDTAWYATNTTSVFEGPPLTGNKLIQSTGTSGRGIHTVFMTQSLTNIGNRITATYTFTTPATVSALNTSSFRVGLFNPDSSANPAALQMDLAASTAMPDANLNLNGYFFDMDVSAAPVLANDIQFRKQDQTPASQTGRLMGTTTGFNSLGNSGPDGNYNFAPNTSYTGSFAIERTGATELTLTGAIGGYSYSVIDDGVTVAGGLYPNIGFFGVHINSNVFGSTNVSGDPNSGIAFTSVNISTNFAAIPEPGTASLLLGGLVSLGLIRRRK